MLPFIYQFFDGENVRSRLTYFFKVMAGIRWLSYLHHNSQSLLIIFVHWTQLSEY